MADIDYGAVALALIETYLGRSLMKAERTERYPAAHRIALRAWPVDSVASVMTVGRWPADTPEDLTEGIVLDAAKGLVSFPALTWPLYVSDVTAWRARSAAQVDGPFLEITYTAGYDELPGPLQTAQELLAAALKTAADNGGQQITYQALDGYQVTYSSKYQTGDSLTMLSPAAAILIAPYKG